MKVKCGNCGNIFSYEENNKVCPKCKKFCALPENTKEKIKKKEERDKKIKQEEENKIYPEPKLFKKKEKTEKQKKSVENVPELKEAEDTIDLKNADDHKKSKKGFYIGITILLTIIILPILYRTDKSEKVIGTDGTIISSSVEKVLIDEYLNAWLYIAKIGYTNSGDLYISYESNICGFVESGYEIEMAITNTNNEYIELGCIKSDFVEIKDEVQNFYATKAIFNYNNEQPRITKLHIMINDVPVKTISY